MQMSWFKRRRKKSPTKADFDFLPLFFWDKGLSDTAKVMMCLMGGGRAYREKTLTKLQETFSSEMVSSLRIAIEELEFYGYITNEEYKGEYGEQRVDRCVCICPNNRLPKLVPPTGGTPAYSRTAYEMFDDARRLGFIAEAGKDTTYLLYTALRFFSTVENILFPYERVVFPQVGTESVRSGASARDLKAYPHAVVGAIITTHRFIFIQEDSDIQGRHAGLARLVSCDFGGLDSIALDEAYGRVTFHEKQRGGQQNSISMDIMTAFALENYEQYHKNALTLLETRVGPPPVSYAREQHFT